MSNEKREADIYWLIIIITFIIILQVQNISSYPIIDSRVEQVLQNQNKIRVIIEFNQSFTKDNIIPTKTEIIFNLSKSEFTLRQNINDSFWFSGEITKEGLEKLKLNENIIKISKEGEGGTLLQQSLPLINATQVWANGYTGKGQTVCVIDSGINESHSDLQGKVLAEYCYCSDNEGATPNCCPDGTAEDNNAEDNFGHGTYVSGIVAARGKINGTAPDAKLVIIKITNSTGNWLDGDLWGAVKWCKDHKTTYNISVITISLGIYNLTYNNVNNCEADWFADSAIDEANASGIFVDIASGNDANLSGISYPACSRGATPIGSVYDGNLGPEVFPTCYDSTTQTDLISCFTNRGTLLNLLAPGCEINSTKIDGTYYWQPHGKRCGTSFAAPHVAGAAAILLQEDPTLTPDEIRDILNKTGKQIYDPLSQRFYSRINILNATLYLNNTCTCTAYTAGSCGAGSCLSSERQSTRTCNPSGCDIESKCDYDSSCVPGGGLGSANDITVCASGCNYTTINNAVVHSDANDKIFVMDNRTYAEEVVLNSTSSGWLECKNNSKLYVSGGGGKGVFLNHADGPVVFGCIIEGYDHGIYLNSSHALIQNNTFINNGEAIYFWKYYASDDKIKYNNITGGITQGLYFYTNTWADSCISNQIEKNILKDNGDEEIYMIYGNSNLFQENNISLGTYYGIYINGLDTNSFTTIQDNIIAMNADGLYNNRAYQNTINHNTFCPSNTNTDINVYSSTSVSGANNTCEKPGIWNDTGTTGCTYYCDSPASVTLLFPPNNYEDSDGNIDLVCEASDNYQLVNVSLYHNLSGTWQINQTRNISGTSNITTFSINNLQNGTTFIWNCLAYDNISRGGFASANWSVKVVIDNIPPDVNIISPLNQTYNISSIDFNATINEDGNCEYSINNGVTNISMSTIDNRNFSSTNSSMINGNYNVRFYCMDAVGNLNYTEGVSFSVNAPIPPNDTNRFYAKNSTGNPVAWLGDKGNIVLKGNCFSGGNCNNPGTDSFIVRNITDSNMAFINSSGDLCIIKGDCSDESASCNPTRTAFIIRNSSDYNMSYIDFDGDLCLTGKLYENSGYV